MRYQRKPDKVIEHKKHLEKHVGKRKSRSKESSQPITNFVKNSDNNNKELIRKWPKGTAAILDDWIISWISKTSRPTDMTPS